MKPRTKLEEHFHIIGYYSCILCGGALILLAFGAIPHTITELPALSFGMGGLFIVTGIFGLGYYIATGEFPIATADF